MHIYSILISCHRNHAHFCQNVWIIATTCLFNANCNKQHCFNRHCLAHKCYAFWISWYNSDEINKLFICMFYEGTHFIAGLWQHFLIHGCAWRMPCIVISLVSFVILLNKFTFLVLKCNLCKHISMFSL